MLERFSQNITRFTSFALAVSGGADSICMTLLCHQLGLKPIVLIVDHKLRHESSLEALYVKDYIEKTFNFQVQILTWDRDILITSNIQSKARDARYKLLINECRTLGIKRLYTAHHKNDQAETVLMNIMRGTGIDGLVGIRELINIDGIEIMRPMLSFTREEIESHLNLHNITWVNDPSNESTEYERVKIRKLMKVISNSDLVNAEHIISRLNLLSNNAMRAQTFIDRYVEKKIREICNVWHLNVVTIEVDLLLLEDEEVILRILRNILKAVGLQKYSVRMQSIMRLYSDISKVNSTLCTTLGGCYIWNGRKSNRCFLVFAKENLNCHKKIPKNQLNSLELAFYHGKPEYMIYNHDVYYKAQKMVENIPKARKILSYMEYEIADGKKFYPSLGIAKFI